MIKRIVVEIIDSPQEDKNIKLLVGLVKLIGKNEISFTESQILKRDLTKNEELLSIVREIIEKYRNVTPQILNFKEGKVKSDGKIIMRWEYENKNTS
jgi:Ethanolamine utilization protein EutJ (predicted chaperonin)